MKSLRVWLLLFALTLASSCSSDDGGGEQGPAGSYTATQLTLTQGDDNTDLLAKALP